MLQFSLLGRKRIGRTNKSITLYQRSPKISIKSFVIWEKVAQGGKTQNHEIQSQFYFDLRTISSCIAEILTLSTSVFFICQIGLPWTSCTIFRDPITFRCYGIAVASKDIAENTKKPKISTFPLFLKKRELTVKVVQGIPSQLQTTVK